MGPYLMCACKGGVSDVLPPPPPRPPPPSPRRRRRRCRRHVTLQGQWGASVGGSSEPPNARVPSDKRGISLSVDGDVRQDAVLGDMIWTVPEIISILSEVSARVGQGLGGEGGGGGVIFPPPVLV